MNKQKISDEKQKPKKKRKRIAHKRKLKKDK
jgi:hypothetical protein